MFSHVANLKDIYTIFDKEEETVTTELQEDGFLNQLKRCPKCRRQEVLAKNRAMKCGVAAYCKTCKKYRSLSDSRFFENVHISFENVFVLIWMWICHILPNDASKLTDVARQTVLQYFRFFRDIASWKLLSLPITKLGGIGRIVQIDESLVTKRKSNKGRLVKEQWIVGMIDTTSKDCVILYVENRSKSVLLPLIKTYVEIGTEVWTDESKGYYGLNQEGFIHRTVNHSKEFKSALGVCTNEIEGLWSTLKDYLRHSTVLWSKLFPEHIDEFMWRYKFQGDHKKQFIVFLDHLKERRYP